MTNVDPTVQKVIDTANAVAADPTVQVTVSKVTPRISAKARNVLYTVGAILGTVGTVGPIIAASLTGNAALTAGSIAALALLGNSLLAKFNLSKTAEDIAKELPTPAPVDTLVG